MEYSKTAREIASTEELARRVVEELRATAFIPSDRNEFESQAEARSFQVAKETGLSGEEQTELARRTRAIAGAVWALSDGSNHPDVVAEAAISTMRDSDPQTRVPAHEAPMPSAESTKRTVAPESTRRVNVNFSEQAYRTLDHLARQTGKSMSDVLRDAIALKAWFEQTRAEGAHVLVERPDGSIREVISV